MILEDIKDIRLGRSKVVKIMLGDRRIYPASSDKYLDVYPKVLWLTDFNELSKDVTITSNTEWKVE